MNEFSHAARRELCEIRYTDDCCRVAFLSALLHTAGTLHIGGGKSITLNCGEALYRSVSAAAEGLFPVEITFSGGCVSVTGGAMELMAELGLIRLSEDGLFELVKGIEPSLIVSDCCKRAYIAGAFLGAGSVTAGKGGSAVQFTFTRPQAASDFRALLGMLDIPSGVSERGDRASVYIKKNQGISDVLAAMGAGKAMLMFNELLAVRQTRSAVNRVNNIEVANIGKTVRAGINQSEDIRAIERAGLLSTLDEKLKEAAKARLKLGSDATLEQLAEEIGVSKGSVKYRLKKIAEIAESLK